MRLKGQALREGQIILYADITYTNSRSGSYPALSAGHTRVISREPRVKPLERLSEFEQPSPAQSGQAPEETDHSQTPAGDMTQTPPAELSAPDRYPDLPDDPQQLLLKEVAIRASIGRMEQRQQQIEQQAESSENVGQKAQARVEVDRLETRRDTMEEELRKVRMAQVAATQQQLLDLIIQNADQAASVARLGSTLGMTNPQSAGSGGLDVVV